MNCWYDLDEIRNWCHPCYSSCLRNGLDPIEWEQCRPLGRAKSNLCMLGPSSWYGCCARKSNYCGQNMNPCSSCCCSPCCCPTACCNMWCGSACCRRLAPIRPRTPKSKKCEECRPKKSARAIQVIKPPKRVSSGQYNPTCECVPTDVMDMECFCRDSTPLDSRSTVRESSDVSHIRSASAENQALMPARNHKVAQESSSGVRAATSPMNEMRSISAENYAAFSSLCPAKGDSTLMHRMEGHMMDGQPLVNKMISQDPCCSAQGQEHMMNPMVMNSHGTSTQTESGFIPIPIKTLSGNVPPQMMGPRMIPMMSMMPGAASGMPMGIPFMCLPPGGGWPMPMACNCIMGRQGPLPTATPIPGAYPGTNFGLTPMGFPHGTMMGGVPPAGMNWMAGSRGSLAPINDYGKSEKPPQEIEELYQYSGHGESGSSGAGTLTSAGRRGGHNCRGRRGGSVRRSAAPNARARQPGCRSSCTGIRSPCGGPSLHNSKRSGRARGTRQLVEGEYRAPSGTASSVGSARQSGSQVDRSHVSPKNRGDLNPAVEPLQFKEPDSVETMSGTHSGPHSPTLSPLPHAIALPAGMMGIGMGPGSMNPCWRQVPSMPCCIMHDSIAKRIFESLVHDPNATMEGGAPRSASADRVQGHWMGMHRQASPASLLMGHHHTPAQQKSSHRSHHRRRSRKSLDAEDFPHRDVDFPVSQKTTCCLFNAATQTLANTFKQRSVSADKRRNYARSRSSSASREIAPPPLRTMGYSEGRSMSETLNRKTKFSAGRPQRSASHGSKHHPHLPDERSKSSSYGREFNYHRSRSRSSSKERKPQKKQVSSAQSPRFNSLECKQEDNRGSQPLPATPSVSGAGASGGGAGGGRDAEGAPRGSSKRSGHSRMAENADDMRSRLSRRAYRSITKAKKAPRQSPGRIKSAVYQMDLVKKEAPSFDQGDDVASQDLSKPHGSKQENEVSDQIMQAYQNISNQADHDCARKPIASCLHRKPESPSVYKCAPISTSPTTSASETAMVPHFNAIPLQHKISVGYKYMTKNSNDIGAPETLRNTSLTYVKQCTPSKQDSSDLLLTGPNEMVLQYDLSEFASSNPMFGKNTQGNLPGSSRPFIVSPPHKISVEYRCSGTPHKRAITYVPMDPQLKTGSTDDVTISLEDQTQIPSLPSMDQPRRRTKETRQHERARGRSRLRGESASEEVAPRKGDSPPKEQEEGNETTQEKKRSRSPTPSKGKESKTESKTSAVAAESFRSTGDLSSSQRTYPSQTANQIQTSPATSELPQQPPTLSVVISQTDAPEESGMTTELTSNQTAGTSSPSPQKSPSGSHRRTLLSFRRRSACKQGRNLSISPLANSSPKSQRQKNANGKQKKATSPPSNHMNTTASNVTTRRNPPRAISFESGSHFQHPVHNISPVNQQANKKPGGGTQTMAEQHCKTNQSNKDPQTSQTTDPSQGNAENQPPVSQVGNENPSGVKKQSGAKVSPDTKDVPHPRLRRRHHHKREHSDAKGAQPTATPEVQKPQQPQPTENQNPQDENQKLPEVQPSPLFPQSLPIQGFPQVQLFQLTSLLSQHSFPSPPPQNQNFTPTQTNPALQQPQTQLQQPPPLTQQQPQAQLINQMFQHSQIQPLPQPQQEGLTYQQSSAQLQTQLYQQHPIFQTPQTHQNPPTQQQSQLFQQSEIFQQQTQPQRIPQQGFPQPSGINPQNSLFQQVNSPITKEISPNIEVPQEDPSQDLQNRSRSASKMRPPQPVSLPELSVSKGRTRSESRGPVSDLTLDGSKHASPRSRSVVNGKFDGTNNQVGWRANTPSENKDYQSPKDFGRPSSQTQQLSKLQRAVQYAATIPRPILKPQRRKRKIGATASSQVTSRLKPLDQAGEIVSQSETQQGSQPVSEGIPTTCLHQNLSPVSSISPGMTPLTSSQNLPSFFPFPTSSVTVSQTPSSVKFSPTPSRQFSSGYASQTNFQSGHIRHQSQADLRFAPNFQFSQICPKSPQIQHTHEFSPSVIKTSTLFTPSNSGNRQVDTTLSVPNNPTHPEHTPLGKHHSEAQLPSSLLSDKHQYDHQSEEPRNVLQKFPKMEARKSETKLEFAFSLGVKSSNPPHNLPHHVSPAVMHTSQQSPFSTPLQCSSKTSVMVGTGRNEYRDDKMEMDPQRKTEFTPSYFQSAQSRSRESNEHKRENSFTNKFLNSGFPKPSHPPFAKSSHPLFALGHPGPINQLRIGMRRQPTLDRISSVSTTAGNTPDDAKTANDVSEGELAMKEEGSVSKEQPDKEEEAPTKTNSEIFGPNETVCLEGESSGNDVFAPEQKRHLVTRSSRLYGGKPSSPEEDPPWSPRNRRPVESRLPIPRRYLGSSSLASNEEGATCRSGTEQTEEDYHVSLREKATSVRFGSSSTQVSRSTPQSYRVQPSATTGQSSPPSTQTNSPAPTRRPVPTNLSPLVVARRQRMAQQRALSVSVTSVEGEGDDHPKRRMRTETGKKLEALQRSQIARQSPSKTRPPNYHPVLQQSATEDRLPRKQPASPPPAPTRGLSPAIPSDTLRSRFGRPDAAAPQKAKHAPGGIQSVHHPDDVAAPPVPRGARALGRGQHQPGQPLPTQASGARGDPKRAALPGPLAPQENARLKGKTGREGEALDDSVTPPARCKDAAAPPLRKMDSRTNRVTKDKEVEVKDKEVEVGSSVSEMPEESVVTIVENPDETKNKSNDGTSGNTGSKESEESKKNFFPPIGFAAMRKSIKNCLALVTAPGMDGDCNKCSKDIIVMHEETSMSNPFLNYSPVHYDKMECPENDKPSIATTKRSSPVLWRKNDFGPAVTNLKKSNSTFLHSSSLYKYLRDPVPSSKSLLDDIVSDSKAVKQEDTGCVESSEKLSKKPSVRCTHVTPPKVGQEGYPLVNSSRAYLEQQFQLLQRNQFYQQQILEQQHQVLQQFQNRPAQETTGPGNEKLKESLPEDHTLQAVTSLDDDEEVDEVESSPPLRRDETSNPGLAKTIRATRALRQAVKDMQLIQGRRDVDGSRYSLIPRGAQTKLIEQTKKSGDVLQHESNYIAPVSLAGGGSPCCRCVSRTVFSWRNSQSQPHVQHCSSHHMRQPQHNLGCSSWHGAAWWANANIPSPQSSCSITQKSTTSTLPRIQSTVSHGRFCHAGSHLRSRSVHPTITEPSIPSASNRSDRWQIRWRQYSPDARAPRHFCSCSTVHRQHDRHNETYNTAGDAGFGSWSRHLLSPCVQAVPMSLQPRASPHKPPVSSAPPTRPHRHPVQPHPPRPRSLAAHDVANTYALASKPSAKRLKLSESKFKVKFANSTMLRLKLSESKLGTFGCQSPQRAFETNMEGKLMTCGSHNWRRLSRKDRILLLQRFHRLERSSQLRKINALHGSRHKLDVPEVLDNTRFRPDDTVELRIDEYHRLMAMADDMARLDDKRFGCRLSATQLNTYLNARPKPRTPPPTPASPKMVVNNESFEMLPDGPSKEDGDRRKSTISEKSSRERKRAKKAKKKKKRTKSAATVTRSVCSKATSLSSYKRSRDRAFYFNADGGGSPSRNSASPGSVKSRRGARRRRRSNPDKSPKR